MDSQHAPLPLTAVPGRPSPASLPAAAKGLLTGAVAAIAALAVQAASAQTFAEVRINHAVISFTTLTGEPGTQTFDDLVFRTEGTRPHVDDLVLNAAFFTLPMPVQGSVVATYDYTLTVADTGGEIPFVAQPVCTSIMVTTCFNPQNREMAFAQLLVGYRDPRATNPFIPGGTAQALLQTTPDDRPDRMTQSGTLTAVFTNTLPNPTSVSFSVLAFGGAFAQPIPEPGTAALLLAGLATLMRLKPRASRHLLDQAARTARRNSPVCDAYPDQVSDLQPASRLQ